MRFMHRKRPNRIQHVGGAATPAPSAPAAVSPPSISGSSTAEGSILTVAPGLFSGYPAPTRSYQWKANGTNISGQTGTTLDTTGQVTKTITVTETATNSEGNTTSTSAGFGPITGTAPTIVTFDSTSIKFDDTSHTFDEAA